MELTNLKDKVRRLLCGSRLEEKFEPDVHTYEVCFGTVYS